MLLLIAAAFISSALRAGEPVTFESLLHEMQNRERVACFPSPAYTCSQASSYDRHAVSPKEKATWYANSDRSFFIRTEEKDGRREYVLMDEAGPGALVRFWSTWHGSRGKAFSNGMLRFYLDGKAEPAIKGPIRSIIDQGALAPPPLSQGVSPKTPYKHRGHNLYLPIPYAKHCKITYETDSPMDPGARKGGEALYYQINFRTYEKGTKVKSFTMEQLNSLKQNLVKKTAKRLLQPGKINEGDLQEFSTQRWISAGSSASESLDGPAAVRQLTIKLAAKDLPQALRSTVLEIAFDGERAVWVPVGDFFGTAYKVSPYKSWYTQVFEDGRMSCYWVMPFQSDCTLTLHNFGRQPVELVLGEARVSPWRWDARSMHFHATWKELNRVKTRTNQGALHGAFDVNYVTVKGHGVFVGDTLTLFNGAPGWWGEGDEKIFVDGEKFPSHFGTGTEDYYGYAWGNPNFFEAPFHAQPYGQGAQKTDLAINSRYRSLDAIPFTSSIQFDMELWHWITTTMNYAPTTYFYARSGASWNVKPDPKAAAEKVVQTLDQLIILHDIPKAHEGETMKIVSKTGGETEIQKGTLNGWSRHKQLWWRDGKPGDRLVLTLPVKKAGSYKVYANLTKAADYATVRLSVNGKPAEKEIHRYNNGVATDEILLGTFELEEGENRLNVEIAGKHEKAVPRYMFGLDYVRLEK